MAKNIIEQEKDAILESTLTKRKKELFKFIEFFYDNYREMGFSDILEEFYNNYNK